MKSQFQILSFLSNYTPKSDLDYEIIYSYLSNKLQITPKTPVFAPNFDANPIDVQSFTKWLKSGLQSLKMARYENSLVILGNCTLEKCEIIGTLLEDGSVDTTVRTAACEDICDIPDEDAESLYAALCRNRLQPSPEKLRLVPKFIPAPGDRVIFYDFSLDVQGVGAIRDISPEGDVTFYCYFTYPTPFRNKRLGYSMHERPGYDIRRIVFESINRENSPTTLGNSTSCFRRLGKELERAGKVWKDKIARIEPLNAKAAVGGKYFYISDQLEVVEKIEKGTPTSHLRYLSGNYFVNRNAAALVNGRIRELLRSYLASDGWPEIE